MISSYAARRTSRTIPNRWRIAWYVSFVSREIGSRLWRMRWRASQQRRAKRPKKKQAPANQAQKAADVTEKPLRSRFVTADVPDASGSVTADVPEVELGIG